MEHCARLVRKLAPRRQALHRALEGFLVSREVRPTTKLPIYAAMTPTAQLLVLYPNAMPYGTDQLGTDIRPNPQRPVLSTISPTGFASSSRKLPTLPTCNPITGLSHPTSSHQLHPSIP
jgi:hypothetical protein